MAVPCNAIAVGSTFDPPWAAAERLLLPANNRRLSLTLDGEPSFQEFSLGSPFTVFPPKPPNRRPMPSWLVKATAGNFPTSYHYDEWGPIIQGEVWGKGFLANHIFAAEVLADNAVDLLRQCYCEYRLFTYRAVAVAHNNPGPPSQLFEPNPDRIAFATSFATFSGGIKYLVGPEDIASNEFAVHHTTTERVYHRRDVGPVITGSIYYTPLVPATHDIFVMEIIGIR